MSHDAPQPTAPLVHVPGARFPLRETERLRARLLGHIDTDWRARLGRRIAAASRLAEVWQDLRHPAMAAPAREAETTGYTGAMMRWGMRQTFAQWTLPRLRELVEGELGLREGGEPMAVPLPIGPVGIVLASTVPPAGLQSAILPLLLGVPVVVRAAGSLGPFVEACLQTVAQLAPELAESIAWTRFDANDTEAMQMLSAACDVVVVHGGSVAIESWRAVRAGRPMVAHGHRLSASFLSRAAQQSVHMGAYLDGIALDMVAWDQSGCLSPHTLYVETDAADVVEVLATRIAQGALPIVEASLGAVPNPNAAARSAFLRPLLFAGTAHVSPLGARVVAMDEDGPLEPGCGQRVLLVRPVADQGALVASCMAAAPHLQALAVGREDMQGALAAQLAPAGLNRLCVHGALQRPPLCWRHDGVGTLAPLVRWATVG